MTLSKFDLHRRTMLHYYSTHPDALRVFIEIVRNRSTVVSLRLLDWFVTNYVTAETIVGETPKEKSQRQNLYFVYSQNLNSYKKVWFDPFARELPEKGSYKLLFNTETFTMEVSSAEAPVEGPIISTTTGQLNFFKCAIEYGIIQHVFEHHERIQRHMLDGLNHRKLAKAEARKNIYKPVETEGYSLEQNITDAFAHDPTVHITIQKRSKK